MRAGFGRVSAAGLNLECRGLDDWARHKEAYELVFTPLVGLVGAVTGFDHGEKAR